MGTRRLSAPGGHPVGPGDILPTGPPRHTSCLVVESPRFTGLGALSPPWLPLFATPWSVHQFAALAAGAYTLRRLPDAWSPGAPVLPGPCYWLVASGTPFGWRGGCLAVDWGIAQCATTALAAAVP